MNTAALFHPLKKAMRAASRFRIPMRMIIRDRAACSESRDLDQEACSGSTLRELPGLLHTIASAPGPLQRSRKARATEEAQDGLCRASGTSRRVLRPGGGSA